MLLIFARLRARYVFTVAFDVKGLQNEKTIHIGTGLHELRLRAYRKIHLRKWVHVISDYRKGLFKKG